MLLNHIKSYYNHLIIQSNQLLQWVGTELVSQHTHKHTQNEGSSVSTFSMRAFPESFPVA